MYANVHMFMYTRISECIYICVCFVRVYLYAFDCCSVVPPVHYLIFQLLSSCSLPKLPHWCYHRLISQFGAIITGSWRHYSGYGRYVCV